MDLNSNFDQRAVVHSSKIDWVKSPMAGVERRMLDRIGGEVARATTIVKYAPKSHFSAHVHTGGEEFLVLEGVFQDEHGDFPAGSYIRNPPQSSHTPGSDAGCVIFVKLWQFDMADRNQLRIDTNQLEYQPVEGHESIETMPLYEDSSEQVSLERWSANASINLIATDGLELLVLEGEFEEQGEQFMKHSWLRLPKRAISMVKTGRNGAKVWIKRNHLALPPQAPVEI